MGDYEDRRPAAPTPIETIGPVIRVIAGILGLFIIVIGLLYAISLFSSIHKAIKTPETFQESLDKWVEVLGEDEMNIKIGGDVFPLVRIIGVMTIAFGVFMLCWLAVGIMLAGARIISWSSGDREAVRKILKEALGITQKVK